MGLSSLYTELFLEVFLAASAGLSLRIMLTLVKQKWVATYHHTMSYILLPLITLTITKVITGDIALSLGMVGALSIVRFRNPVKNPFELVIFFALVTIGIAMSAKIQYGIMLTVMINAVIFGSYVLEKIGSKFGFQMYSLSFDEGNSFNTLEISSTEEVSALNDSKLLLQYVHDKSTNTRHYRLASRAHNTDLNDIRKALEDDERITHIEARYS